MKKLFLILGLCLGLLGLRVYAETTLGQALASNKSFVLLICSSWAEGNDIYMNMQSLSSKFKDYSYVRVDLW